MASSRRVKDFWFLFSGTAVHPITRLCRAGFKHVAVLTDLEGIPFMLDPLQHGVNISFNADYPLPHHLSVFKAKGYRIVHITVEPRSRRQNLILTCASYLAYTCGIPFWGLTPYQLYKTLINQGGTEL